LINVFIRQLSVNFDNVAVINVDNWDPNIDKRGGGVKQGQLFFQSSVSFQDTFTTLLGRQLRSTRNAKLATINVKINFRNLSSHDSFRVQNELCEKTFKKLGLEDTIYIK